MYYIVKLREEGAENKKTGRTRRTIKTRTEHENLFSRLSGSNEKLSADVVVVRAPFPGAIQGGV